MHVKLFELSTLAALPCVLQVAALEGEKARLTEELGKATQAARHSAQQAVKIEGLEKELAHFQVWTGRV